MPNIFGHTNLAMHTNFQPSYAFNHASRALKLVIFIGARVARKNVNFAQRNIFGEMHTKFQ